MNSHVAAAFEKEITRDNIKLVTNLCDKNIQIEWHWPNDILFFFPTAENVTEKEKEECPFNNAVNW
jgi:hypothetical protein